MEPLDGTQRLSKTNSITSCGRGSEAGQGNRPDHRSRRPTYDEEIPLTNREVQVLRHVALGLSNREIGRTLDISIETVKEHVQNILRKLEASDRTEAAVWAVKKGLV